MNFLKRTGWFGDTNRMHRSIHDIMATKRIPYTKYPWKPHVCQTPEGRRRHAASKEINILLKGGKRGLAVESINLRTISTMLRIHFCPFCAADLNQEVRQIQRQTK